MSNILELNEMFRQLANMGKNTRTQIVEEATGLTARAHMISMVMAGVPNKTLFEVGKNYSDEQIKRCLAGVGLKDDSVLGDITWDICAKILRNAALEVIRHLDTDYSYLKNQAEEQK